MKRYFYIIIAIVSSLMLASCQKVVQPDGSQYAGDPALEVLSKSVVFTPQGGSGFIVVSTNEKVIASSERPWLSCSVAGNRISLTAERNESLESRYSTMTIVAGDASATVMVQQFGITSDLLWDASYDFPYGGGEVKLNFVESGTVKVAIDQPKWISAEVGDQELTITVAKNAYNSPREGKVTVTVADAVREVGIVQAPNPSGYNPGDPEPHDFEVQSAWTPKYVGPSETHDDKSVVGVDVAEEAKASRYFIKVVPASEFAAAGGDDNFFLNKNAQSWVDEDPDTFRNSATVEVDKLEYGSYRIYAVGVTNQKEINYTYAVATAEVTKVLSPYEKFLGTWAVPRGSFEDTWTISEKVFGESYTIVGIDARDVPVEATFDASSGSLVVRANDNIGTNTIETSDGEVTGTAAIYGKIDYQGTIYYITYGSSPYVIFTATLDDVDAKSATLNPGTVNITSLGGEFTLVGYAIFTLVGESAYSATTMSPLPNTITHLTYEGGSGGGDDGGGGDGGGGGGDTSYSSYLGSWRDSDGNVFTFSQKSANSSYTFSGFELDVEVVFKDNKVLFYAQTITTDDTYDYLFTGIDQENYVEDAEQNKDPYLMAQGTLSGNTISIEGEEFDAVYSGNNWHEIIVEMRVLAYDREEGSYYLLSDDPVVLSLPAKLTKASQSSLSSCRAQLGRSLESGSLVASPLGKTSPKRVSPLKKR